MSDSCFGGVLVLGLAEMTSPQQRRIETISRHITSSSPSKQRLPVEGQDCAAGPARLLEGQVLSCA